MNAPLRGARLRSARVAQRPPTPHDGLAADRSQFYEDLSAFFYGANREGSTVSQVSAMPSG